MASARRTTLLFTALAGAAVLATACSAQPDTDAPERPAKSSAAERSDRSPEAEKSEPASGQKKPGKKDPAADRALLEAARSGDADAVRAAVDRGADLEARDDSRRTPLLLAATGDHVEAAEILVDAGADPDALDQQHDTPWLVTGVTGSAEMARVLANADPDYGILNRYGGTSLIPAGEHGHVDYIREVTTNPAIDVDIDHVNDLGWTALLEAVILGDGGKAHQQSVKLLLDGGADRDIKDNTGKTALDHAEEKGQDEIARLLRG